MGQRSQIYFRINRVDGRYDFVARYFGWNYGTRMVSRARHTIEYFRMKKDSPYSLIGDEGRYKISRIMEVNFDYHDIIMSSDILKEYENGDYGDDYKAIIVGQDNNDGQLLIDVCVDYEHPQNCLSYNTKIKYAFLDCRSDYIGDADAYMQWDTHYGAEGYPWRYDEYIKNEVKYTERNIRYLQKNAKLMTPAEVNEYINHNYISDMDIKRKEN